MVARRVGLGRVMVVGIWIGLRITGLPLLPAQAEGVEPEPGRSQRYEQTMSRLVREGLGRGKGHALLTELCTSIGPRLSGSPQAEKAVAWAKGTMEKCELERVRLEPIMVPHWVRGAIEEAVLLPSGPGRSGEKGRALPVKVCALGGSIGTPHEGITAEVLEVRTFDELRAAGAKARGKIIFFNRGFDRGLFSPFAMYGGAVGQRGQGPTEAGKSGGVLALVRSMTPRMDDVPHTGATYYAEGLTKVPAAAISTRGAERLSAELVTDPQLRLRITLSCQTLPDVPSANVVGELVGSERPGEVIVIGGHLDSWDKGQGAHDDGAGCIHAIEALRLLKVLGVRPRRTIRAVLFMNEENGLRGGLAYAATKRPDETHIAAIESDSGGFTPRGFGIGGPPAVLAAVTRWKPLFTPIEADLFRDSGGGADIGPLMGQGVPGFGLLVDGQRYFDYHHSDHDTIESVHERELELGAIALAMMSYLVAEEGLPAAPPQRTGGRD